VSNKKITICESGRIIGTADALIVGKEKPGGEILKTCELHNVSFSCIQELLLDCSNVFIIDIIVHDEQDRFIEDHNDIQLELFSSKPIIKGDITEFKMLKGYYVKKSMLKFMMNAIFTQISISEPKINCKLCEYNNECKLQDYRQSTKVYIVHQDVSYELGQTIAVCSTREKAETELQIYANEWNMDELSIEEWEIDGNFIKEKENERTE